MRRAAGHLDVEACRAFARCDDLAALARRLGDEHVAGAFGLALDDIARSLAADLLVGDEEMADGERRRAGGRDEMAQRRKGNEGAALHVVDAGTKGDVALDLEGQWSGERAYRMHGVEMAEHEDAGLVFATPGRGHHEMVAIAVAAMHPFDDGLRRSGIGLDLVDHAVDGGRIGGRAFDDDPGADFIEELLGVEGRRVGGSHGVIYPLEWESKGRRLHLSLDRRGRRLVRRGAGLRGAGSAITRSLLPSPDPSLF